MENFPWERLHVIVCFKKRSDYMSKREHWREKKSINICGGRKQSRHAILQQSTYVQRGSN